MAYSRTRFILDAGSIATPTFSYAAFPTLGAGADPENVQFDVYWMETLLVLNTDYSVNTTNNTITLLSTITGDLVADEVISIKRDTKKDDRYVDWTNNAGITEADLDLDSDQLFFLAQEAWDEALTALRKAPSETKWDGEGLPSYNCSPALVGSGWVTLDQVNNLINGGDTATLGDVNEWCFDGDGVTEDFVLNGASANTTEENLFVTVNGVSICPCDTHSYLKHPDYGRLASFLVAVPLRNEVGTTKVFWDGDLDTLISDIEDAFDAAVLAGTLSQDIVDSATILYRIEVTAQDSGTGTPPAQSFPTEFIGTASECIAYIATWAAPTNAWSGSVRWHDIIVGDMAYTWDQATRTLSFTDAPTEGSDICIRQLTGTVAVDLADVSLDGSELQDDSVGLNHLDFASGTAYRVLKVDAAGDPSVGTITSAYVSDFTAAVQSLQWSSMTDPSASVDLNTQKIINLQAGSSVGDAVNYAQLSSTNTRVTDLETAVDGGLSGPNSATGLTPTIGVAPDVYYNNASNSRGAYTTDPIGVATACNTEGTAGDSQVLLKGFIPRHIKIFINGNLARVSDSVVRATNLNHVWEFDNWDSENGFTSYVSTEGSNKVYLLKKPWKQDQVPSLDWPGSNVDGGSNFYLVIEQVTPYRVWFRIKDDSNAPLKVTRAGGSVGDVATLPGSLQVTAVKGL